MILSNSTNTAIILAGGLGSRLKKINPLYPKPMALINNIPFLEYLLIYWSNLGIKTFILQVSYKYEIIKNHFGNSFRGIKIIYEVEKYPLGTGGGMILSEKKYNKNNILVLNGDTLVDCNYFDFIKFHEENQSGLSLICRKDNEIESNIKFSLDISFKVVITNNDNDNDNDNDNLINCGVYLVRKDFFKKYINKSRNYISFENEILTPLIQEKKVFGYLQNSFFIDIGTPKNFNRAQTEIPKYFNNR